MYPPDDVYLIETTLFGIPVVVRWYAVFILSGVMLAGWIGARRAQRRGINPDHIWNTVMLGLILGVLFARIWYVVNEWERFRGQDFMMIINPRSGGLAIHGAILGAVLSALIYTRIHKLNLLDFLDLAGIGFPLAQAIGRWGNFFNQEAYGRPMSGNPSWGLRIDEEHRIGEYENMVIYPESTRFHPTFLYESLWNLFVFGLLLTLERRFAGRFRRGDTFLLYGILYSIGRFFVEDLRVDKLCTGGTGGAVCEAGLSTARLTSVVMIVSFGAILIGRRLLRPNPPASAYQPTLQEDAVAAATPSQARDAADVADVEEAPSS